MYVLTYAGEIVEMSIKKAQKADGIPCTSREQAERLQQAMAIARWKNGYRLPCPFDVVPNMEKTEFESIFK